MKKKILIVLLIILILCSVLGFIFYKNNKDDSSSDILLTKTTSKYPYREVLKIESNGKLYKSKIIDELTINGAPEDQFEYVQRIAKDDLEEINKIIDNMKTEQRKQDNYSESYGIAVNLDDDALYDCIYFYQSEIDKLNSIIKKYE